MRYLLDSSVAGALASIQSTYTVMEEVSAPNRIRYLLEAGEGDTILTRPQAFPFWRAAAPAARVVDVLDEENELGAGERLDLSVPGEGLVWALGVIVPGMTVGKARTIAKAPPKTSKHHLYRDYQDAVKLEQEVVRALSEIVTITPKETFVQTMEWREEQLFNYEIVDSEEVVERAVEALARHYTVTDRRPSGVDVESDVVGDKPNETQDILVGVGVAFGDQCFYAPVSYAPWAKFLRTWLPNLPFVSHNAKYDQVMLERHSFRTGKLAGDSMVAAYIAGEPEAALKKLVKNKYDYQMLTYEEVVGDRPVSEVPVSETAPYCCADAYFSLRYHNDFVAGASPSQLKVYLEIDVPAVAVVSKMELAGIKFDVEAASQELRSCGMAIQTLTGTIRERASISGFSLPETIKTCPACRNGRRKKLTCELCNQTGKAVFPPEPLNPMSNDQLKSWFHGSEEGSLGLPVQGLTNTGKPALNALALLRLRQPPHNCVEAALALSLRRQVKYRGYLVDWIVRAIKDKESRIHSTFTTTVVSTGRFSSREPNLQQVKLGWRNLFVASPGKTLVVADYNQLEVRIAAHLSQDPALLAAMRAPVGTPEADLHGQNVERLFGVPMAKQGERKDLRVSAKTYLFAAMYGGREDTLMKRLEAVALNNPDLHIPLPTFKEVGRSLRVLHRTYPRYFAEYAGFVVYQAREESGVFRTAYGRERKLDDLFSLVKSEREAAEREGLNLTVQGTAADIIKIAMAKVDRIPHGQILLQVHDELVCEVDNEHVVEYTKALESAMEIGQPLTVPLIIDAVPATNWYLGHK